ncbi:DNA-binding protein [Undibacterium parvum]|uniref:DNA-binding protein n=1 Tax=Undibacterium parvum TaxID=401471 RepID=A0A3S9HPJ2_9BURK|nr:DNA-binding protein [Undibacterium parvum]AZP14007.1 DNA-binding protein [Undibacterium parvum]
MNEYMDTLEQNERMLLADIDVLRNQFPQTQDLYREVCVAMFFRYGMTPTANKLYQLVRKGSMSAPAEALNRFWENLRDKSRVTVSHPDLPESLKTAAGDLVATLWSAAQNAAQETLASLKVDVLLQVEQANDKANLAVAARDQAISTFNSMQKELMETHTECDVLKHEITALISTNSSLESQLEDSKNDISVSNAKLDDALRELVLEMEKLRASAKLNEDRLASAERRALLEIDRERTANIRLQKALETARVEYKMKVDVHHAESNAFQSQMANLRQTIGNLEGAIQAASEAREIVNRELIQLKIQISNNTHALAGSAVERDLLLRKLHECELGAAKNAAAIQPTTRAKRRKTE